MYRYHTPSGDKSCDGLAMALRAGLPLRDMEMVQFHPTGLLAGPHTRMTGTVLEEGLRGAGGYLLNGAKSASCRGTTRRRARHARPRLARHVRGDARGQHHAATAASTSRWRTSARRTCARVQGHGRALRRLRLRSRGRAGRGRSDRALHDGRRGVRRRRAHRRCEGLFVAGEDTGGVHGANRLGGNGVANSTVFGGDRRRRDGRVGAPRRAGSASPTRDAIDAAIARCERPFARPRRRPGADARRALRHDVGRGRHPARRRGPARRTAELERSMRALDATGIGRRATARSTSPGTTG